MALDTCIFVCTWLLLLALNCPAGVSLMVKRAVVLNQLISSINWTKPSYSKKLVLEVDKNMYTGFLITIVNTIDMNVETCTVFDNIALIEFNFKNISLSCSHYLVHYANSPLYIRVVPSVFSSLSENIKVVVTGVRLSCSAYSMKFRRCPNHELFCIPRSLFCDGHDNCGLNSDEKDCVEPHARFAINIVDSRSPSYISIVTVSLAVVSICVGVLLLLLYNWYVRVRRGYHSEHLERVFGHRVRKLSNCEAERTVMLLTRGVEDMLPYVPSASRRLSNYRPVRLNGTIF